MKMLFGYNFGKLSVAVISDSQKQADRGDWNEIDPNSLPEHLAKAYVAYKEAYNYAKELRKEFEDGMREQVGIKAEVKTKQASAKAVSLASFLAQQAGNGRHV